MYNNDQRLEEELDFPFNFLGRGLNKPKTFMIKLPAGKSIESLDDIQALHRPSRATERPSGSHDIIESEEKLNLIFDMPGVDRKDISIEYYPDGRLSVVGKRDPEQYSDHDKASIARWHGEIRADYVLPGNYKRGDDAINATFDNGVLSVMIDKVEKPKPSMITIH